MGKRSFGQSSCMNGSMSSWPAAFDEMTNLSRELRERLNEAYTILPVEMLERQESNLDGTNKFLFMLHDQNVVESVLMRYKHGNSVCISSQVGCRMGCRFCASTIGWSGKESVSFGDAGAGLCRYRELQGSGCPMWSSWAPGNRWTIMTIFVRFIRLLTDEHGLTYQPEECDGFHLRDCTKDAGACRGRSADHAGSFPAWVRHRRREKN